MTQLPEKKKFKMFDAVLASVCVVMTIEASAPAAKMGNSQFFWWGILILTFFLPYGLISAELGTAYQGQGGIYEWVKKAYGPRWGSRVACYYWFNFPVWVSSIVLLFTEILCSAFHLNIGTGGLVGIELLLIWLVTLLSCFRVSDSKWILNLAAVFKAVMMLFLGGLGFYIAFHKGVANPFTLQSFLPSFDSQGLSYVIVILFDLVGFEVITTYTDDMERPDSQLPLAIKLGGALIIFFYVLAAFGISVAIPVNELSASTGVIESFRILLHRTDGILIGLIAVMFLYALFANLISWSLGVNYVLKSAAQDHSLPGFLAAESKKNKMPVGAAAANGIISSAIVVLGAFMPDSDVFWQFFAMNMIVLMMSYVMMFPAFLKLRKIDPSRPRPFRVKGGMLKLKLMAYLPMCLIILSIVFTVLPLNLSSEELNGKIPLMIGSGLVIAISEWISYQSTKTEEIVK
ncbi:APC family permease [Caproiciproducens faecalis]|uniref:APC family permease n=1 Tax=Caproiciproducens faecalis TaxID=2820301 RepID=A0ABS7DJN4_9FIRM|nr:APC family permease [Caproiciproducens faecalis]MBW7571307.1 APC family permease [Caproiciproducens faecalis]